MSLRLNLAKEHTSGRIYRRDRVLVGGQVGAQLGKGEQVVGIANADTDYAFARRETVPHKGRLLLIKIGIHCRHKNDICRSDSLLDALAFGSGRLIRDCQSIQRLMVLADTLWQIAIGIAAILHLSEEVFLVRYDQDTLVRREVQRDESVLVFHQGRGEVVGPITQLLMLSTSDEWGEVGIWQRLPGEIALFEVQDTLGSLAHDIWREFVGLNRGTDSLKACTLMLVDMRDQHQIGSGLQGHHGTSRDADPFRDRIHLKAVGDNDTLKAQLFAQQAGQDCGGEGRRQVIALRQCRKGDMGRHHRSCSGRDTTFEGHQLDRFQALHRVRHDWERQMRIHGGITMAREMFEAANDSSLVIAFDHRSAQTSNQLRIFAKGAYTNHRISRVVIDIDDWGQIHIEAKRMEFLTGSQGHIMGYLLRTDRTQGHVPWKDS